MRLVSEADFLGAMRVRFAREGLNIVLPIEPAKFDEATATVGGPGIRSLLPEAAGAIVVGDGGSRFFSRFWAARAPLVEASSDPLDGYTRARVADAMDDVLRATAGEVTLRICFPFVNERPPLPFQRLGCAGGLPSPGPLGIQIHPVYGPWWAYRALVLVSVPLNSDSAAAASCTDCSRPCVAACPAQAVSTSGFSVERCMSRRRSDPGCRSTCAARIRCPIGASHRYPDDQLAFHMKPAASP